MRTVCLLLIVVAACKTDKQEAKPSPLPPAPEVKQPPALPPAEAPKPAEATPRVVKPAGGIKTAAEYEAKAFDLTDKLTAVFGAAGTNCDKLADNLEIFVDENQAALAGTDAFETANPFAEDDLEPKLQTRAKTLIQKMALSMQACGKNQRVQGALAKLPD
jgi:hypothetical protein